MTPQAVVNAIERDTYMPRERVWRMPAMLRGVGLGADAAFGTAA